MIHSSMTTTKAHFNPYGKLVTKSFWVTFRDYGYRLLTRFSHMVYLGHPMQVERHILQNGMPEDYNPSQHYPRIHEHEFSVSRSAYSDIRMAKRQDVVIMGAQEMLDAVTDEFSWKGHDLFVRGIGEDGKFVCLDLERDAVDPAEVSLVPSIDVDSLIWVTHQLKTRLKAKLMLTPTVRKTPPIHKSNHVYFELLVPPTDQERVDRGHRKWPEINMPLSSCPHTQFAQSSDSVNIYIMFPRMIHRDEHSGRRITLMPLDLQKIFWDKVLLPALREHVDEASRPYMDFTVEEFQNKTASKARPTGANHYNGTSKVVDPSVLERIIATM